MLIQKSVWSTETNIQTIKEIFEKVALDFQTETGEANEKIIKKTYQLFKNGTSVFVIGYSSLVKDILLKNAKRPGIVF